MKKHIVLTSLICLLSNNQLFGSDLEITSKTVRRTCSSNNTPVEWPESVGWTTINAALALFSSTRYAFGSAMINPPIPTPLLASFKTFIDSQKKELLRQILDDTGQTVITAALNYQGCRKEDIYKVTKIVLEAGADVNQPNRLGATPLHELCRWRYLGEAHVLKIIDLLITHGANVDALDKSGSTPLLRATGNFGISEVLLSLLKAGAKTDVVETDYGFTPLMDVCRQKSDPQDVRILLKHGAKIDKRDKHGSTALHWELHDKARPEVVQLLVDHKADVNAKDNEGNTPLMYAVKDHSSDVSLILLRAGAHVDDKDELGRTPLIIACNHRTNALKKIALLLEYGANLSDVDEQGNTPLRFAQKDASPEGEALVSFLLDHLQKQKPQDNTLPQQTRRRSLVNALCQCFIQ